MITEIVNLREDQRVLFRHLMQADYFLCTEGLLCVKLFDRDEPPTYDINGKPIHGMEVESGDLFHYTLEELEEEKVTPVEVRIEIK